MQVVAHPHEAHDSPQQHDNRSFGPGSGGTDCGAALVELYRYLDGELPLEGRTRIQQHLQDCGGCLSSFDFERLLWRVLRLHLGGPTVDSSPPPTLVTRITITLQTEARNLGEGGLNRPD